MQRIILLLAVFYLILSSASCRLRSRDVVMPGKQGAEGVEPLLAGSIIIADYPEAISRDTTLKVKVSGEGILGYRYKVASAAEMVCADTSGYSTYLDIAVTLKEDISVIKDGEVRLCIVGLESRDSALTMQNLADMVWTKKTKTAEIGVEWTLVEGTNSVVLKWNLKPGSESPDGFILGRFEKGLLPHLQNGTEYKTGEKLGHATIIYVGSAVEFKDDGVLDGNTYRYLLASYDKLKNYSQWLIRDVGLAKPGYAWLALNEKPAREIDLVGSNEPETRVFFCRARHLDDKGGDLGVHIGKFSPETPADFSKGGCLFEYDGRLITGVVDIELLVMHKAKFDDLFRWEPGSATGLDGGTFIPNKSMGAGRESNSTDILYPCRAYGSAARLEVIGIGKTGPNIKSGCDVIQLIEAKETVVTSLFFDVLTLL